MRAYVLELQLFLERFFSLVQAAELVDLLLVLATDLDLVARSDLVIFGKLPCGRQQAGPGRAERGLPRTMRRFIVAVMLRDARFLSKGSIGSSNETGGAR